MISEEEAEEKVNYRNEGRVSTREERSRRQPL